MFVGCVIHTLAFPICTAGRPILLAKRALTVFDDLKCATEPEGIIRFVVAHFIGMLLVGIIIGLVVPVRIGSVVEAIVCRHRDTSWHYFEPDDAVDAGSSLLPS
jgi:hypothetical protein